MFNNFWLITKYVPDHFASHSKLANKTESLPCETCHLVGKNKNKVLSVWWVLQIKEQNRAVESYGNGYQVNLTYFTESRRTSRRNMFKMRLKELVTLNQKMLWKEYFGQSEKPSSVWSPVWSLQIMVRQKQSPWAKGRQKFDKT